VTSSLLRALGRALTAPGAPRAGEHVLVAASGGPDSTALLTGLAHVGPERGLALSVGHVDHGLRGAESRADAQAVEALAERLGLACRVRVGPIEPGGNLESRARAARHRALAAMATEAGASRIALAHTEDDQVETVLLRLLRGAGRRGLGGMPAVRGRLWRPLLAATRADVRRYLADQGLPFSVDRTNADLRYARNRLRRLVIPLLTREFNPRLGAAVTALATRLQDEDEFLRNAAAVRAAAHCRGDALATTVLEEPPALARRIVRAWLDAASPRRTTAADVERVLRLAAGEHGGNVAVPGPGRIVREGDVLVRRAGRDPVRRAFRRDVVLGGIVEGPAGWRLEVSGPRPRGAEEMTSLSGSVARFDAEALALPLVVRSPRPGDRIRIAGVGTRKLQDVLVDAKVPRERRPEVPVLVDATGTILWVAGIVRGAEARIGPATGRVIDMTLR